MDERPTTEDIDLTFRRISARLRAIRKIAGIRQVDLAQICGVDQSTWSKWENGTRAPDLLPVMRFALRAKASLDLILLGRPTTSQPDLIRTLRRLYPELLAPDTVPDPHTDSQESYRKSIRPDVVAMSEKTVAGS